MSSPLKRNLMIPRFYLCLLFCFGLTCFLQAQSIAPSVIAAQGQVFSSPGHRLSFTTGEPVTASLASGGNVLTQGFHQPNLVVTALETQLPDPIEVSYWPNPTRDLLHVQISENGQEPQVLELFDLRGKFLQRQNVHPGETVKIDLTAYTAGIYFLRVSSPQSTESASYKIQKLQ